MQYFWQNECDCGMIRQNYKYYTMNYQFSIIKKPRAVFSIESYQWVNLDDAETRQEEMLKSKKMIQPTEPTEIFSNNKYSLDWKKDWLTWMNWDHQNPFQKNLDQVKQVRTEERMDPEWSPISQKWPEAIQQANIETQNGWPV